jgi:hypothetical protein
MKYTKDDLANMSDFEINTALLDAASIKWQVSAVDDEVAMINSCSDVFDFNDWALIMPLAVENGVCLTSPIASHQNKWQASQTDGGGKLSVDDCYFSDESPQRAIACCLILVLQECKS